MINELKHTRVAVIRHACTHIERDKAHACVHDILLTILECLTLNGDQVYDKVCYK